MRPVVLLSDKMCSPKPQNRLLRPVRFNGALHLVETTGSRGAWACVDAYDISIMRLIELMVDIYMHGSDRSSSSAADDCTLALCRSLIPIHCQDASPLKQDSIAATELVNTSTTRQLISRDRNAAQSSNMQSFCDSGKHCWVSQQGSNALCRPSLSKLYMQDHTMQTSTELDHGAGSCPCPSITL